MQESPITLQKDVAISKSCTATQILQLELCTCFSSQKQIGLLNQRQTGQASEITMCSILENIVPSEWNNLSSRWTLKCYISETNASISWTPCSHAIWICNLHSEKEEHFSVSGFCNHSNNILCCSKEMSEMPFIRDKNVCYTSHL